MKQKSELMIFACMAMLIGCQPQKTTEQIQPVTVNVVKMSAKALNGEQCYSGTVEESNGSSLSFSVGGTVKQVFVNAGQRVSRGQLLAIADDQTVRNSYIAALSIRKQAEMHTIE